MEIVLKNSQRKAQYIGKRYLNSFFSKYKKQPFTNTEFYRKILQLLRISRHNITSSIC